MSEWQLFTAPSPSLSNSSFGRTIKLNSEKAAAGEVDAPQWEVDWWRFTTPIHIFVPTPIRFISQRKKCLCDFLPLYG